MRKFFMLSCVLGAAVCSDITPIKEKFDVSEQVQLQLQQQIESETMDAYDTKITEIQKNVEKFGEEQQNDINELRNDFSNLKTFLKRYHSFQILLLDTKPDSNETSKKLFNLDLILDDIYFDLERNLESKISKYYEIMKNNALDDKKTHKENNNSTNHELKKKILDQAKSLHLEYKKLLKLIATL